ncbi:hypothetical protein M6D93_05385 [Jatrophihabitans telluris]|uniref:Transposase n=1 Tax=Jatrophihabitans telluris TaxID=2038343 RepID=A0ABY4R111_9ACTN|nr:hypothetical protein [Jatrophihabitans telluris]UQX89438.1 hypothetical protein M6D93_05385 [Jatrophihabitans telluris]
MTDGPLTLDEVADQLYLGDPESFTATRTALAKQARGDGEKELAQQINKLRRPTVAADAVNRLARDEPELIAELLDLGARMRQAHRSLSGDVVRELSAARRSLVDGLVRKAAAGSAPGGLSDAVQRQLNETFDAAVADEGAAQAVSSGRLVTALSYAGFGAVDLSQAVDVPRQAGQRPPRRPTPSLRAVGAVAADGAARPDTAKPDTAKPDTTKPDTTKQDTAKQDAARQRTERRAASERWQQARTRVAEQRRTVADAQRRADRLAHRVAELSEQLRRAQDDADAATAELTREQQSLDDAETSAAQAQQLADGLD